MRRGTRTRRGLGRAQSGSPVRLRLLRRQAQGAWEQFLRLQFQLQAELLLLLAPQLQGQGSLDAQPRRGRKLQHKPQPQARRSK